MAHDPRRHQERLGVHQALLSPCAAAVFLALLFLSCTMGTFERSVPFAAHAFVLRQTTCRQQHPPAMWHWCSSTVGGRRLMDHQYLFHQQTLFTNSQNGVLVTFTQQNSNVPGQFKKKHLQRWPSTRACTKVSTSTESNTCYCVDVDEQKLQHHAHGRFRQNLTSLSILFWIISMLSHAAPFFVRHPRLLLLRFAALPSIALAMPTVASKAKHAIFTRHKVDASCMMLAASLGALALGEYTESAAVTSLFAVSHVLEDRAADRSASALSKVARELGPGRARLLVVSDDQVVSGQDGTIQVSEEAVDIPADQVCVGSSVSVPVGDKTPCDGVILSGNTFMDESSVTGESRPLRKITGDTVSAGCVNVGPERIVVQTTAMAFDSTVARLAKLVEDSLSRKSPTEVMMDKLAGQYAPVVFCVALVMATIPWAFFGSDIGRMWTRRGLVTMVAACPCPLVISTPVTYIAALAVTAQEGIIVKGGAILEVSLQVYFPCMLSPLQSTDTVFTIVSRLLVRWTKLHLTKPGL